MCPVRVVISHGVVPRVTWRWESETDILSGGIEPRADGRTGTVELSDGDTSHLAGFWLAGVPPLPEGLE